jgi:Cyanophycin synthase-like N-terminal domain
MKNKDIIIREIIPLRGPNMWTYRPVLEAWVDIGELEEFPSNKIPGFYERLSAWLPSLIEHRCNYNERGGFLRRVQEGTWPACRAASARRARRRSAASTRSPCVPGTRTSPAPRCTRPAT